MTIERRRRRWHWLASLVAAWSLVFLSIALCEAEQIRPASPSGSQHHHHHHDCHSLRPRLTVQKHLLPATHLDSRDRSVTVVVEWQLDVFLPDERGAWEECRYVVRVTDSVPGLPLRVPNELAHLFATTHNNSYVHREYPITFNTDASSSSIMQRDSWNYTLLIQPVSLSPLNDSLRLALPSPQLTLLAAHADDTEARRVIDSAAPDSPTVLTLSLYYAPASVSLYDALGLSLACMAAILVCHFLTAGRLDKAVRMREERVKQKKAATHAAEQSSPPTAAPVDTTAPAASAAQRSVVRDNLAVGGSATPAPPDDATSSSPSAPTPYRFKAKDTRKRFTRPQPSGGSMDF